MVALYQGVNPIWDYRYRMRSVADLYHFPHNKANIQQKIQEFENEKEKELYQAKIDFFINIAHEIRTPLTLIKSPLEKVTRDIKLSPSAKNYLTIVDKNANRLLDLVNQYWISGRRKSRDIN